MPSTGTVAPALRGIVGVRQWDDRSVRVYRRLGKEVRAETHPHLPWLLARDPALVEGLSEEPESLVPLEGPEPLRWLLRYRRLPVLWEAIQRALARESERRHQRLASYLEIDDLYILADPVEQWLAASASTFYVDLAEAEIVRLQLALQTAAPPGRTSRADRSEDRILTIAATVHDGRKSVFRLKKNDERALLNDFVAWFRETDPDIVEGEELFAFTLPYLANRCALLGLSCDLGREDTSLRLGPAPIGKGFWEMPGRTLLDPAETLRHSGPSVQALLPPLRRHAGTNGPSRASLSPLQQCTELRAHTERLVRLAHAVVPHIPLTPERFFRTGPGHWLEAWLLGSSVRSGSAMPAAERSTGHGDNPEPNGTTGLFAPAAELVLVPLKVRAISALDDGPGSQLPSWVGRIRAAWESPSSLAHAISWHRTGPPAGPLLPIILLTGLADAMRARTSRLFVPEAARRLDGRILDRMRHTAAVLGTFNVVVIQQAADRLYVEFPDNLGDEERERKFWNKCSSQFPEGLLAVPVRRFDALVSLGPRVLIGTTGPNTVHLLRSHQTRATEQFLREYHARTLGLILERRWNRLQSLTTESIRKIRARSWHVGDFCRRETLTESLEEYVRAKEAKRRNPAAAYEALLRAEEAYQRERERMRGRSTGAPAEEPQRKQYAAGTTVVYYVAGTRRDLSVADMSRLAEFWDPSTPDENTDYYVDRLRQATERYRPLLVEEDFMRVFSDEGLFPFQDADIRPLRTAFSAAEAGKPPSAPAPGIWLDVEGA